MTTGKLTRAASVLAILFLIGAVLFSGCAAPAPAPTAAPAAPTAAAPAPAAPTTAPAAPTQAPAPAPTTAAQPAGPVIELKYHHHDTPQSITSAQAHNAFAKLIEEKTNGRVKITVYPAETLGKSATAIDMALNGVADISWGFTGQFPGRFPITDILSLPMLGQKTAAHGSKVIWEMYKSSPEIQKEWENLHVLHLHSSAPHVLAFGSKKVQSLEEIKGARLRSLGGAPLKFLQAIGAQPVTVPAPEAFEAVQKGTIDGASFDWNGVGAFRLDDIVKYVLEDQLYPSTFFLVMNKKKWDSLPPDIQKVFNEVAGDAGSAMYAKAWDNGSAGGKESSLKKGVQVLTLTDEERARWQKAAEPVWNEYVKVATEKGADGKALLEKVKAMYKQYAP